MAFNQKTWKGAPDTSTPITATELNRMEKGIKDAHDLVANAPTKAQMTAAIQVVENDANAMNETIGLHTTEISAIKGVQTGQATAISGLQTSKADKTALDKKVDIATLAKTYAEALPVPHVDGVVDFNELDFGEHIIQTNNAVNGPHDTLVTLVQVVRTHSAADHSFPYVDIPDDQYEQGTTNNGGLAGKSREELVELPNSLAPSRVRCKTLIPVEELGNIRITGKDFMFYLSYFGEDLKTIGRETNWTWGNVIAPPGARYFQVVVRKADSSNITPESVFGQFKVGVAKNDIIKGEGRLQVAWGATKGDLHTRIGIKTGGIIGYGMWTKIGSVLPEGDIEEGSTLQFRGGGWKAIPPPTEVSV